MKMMTICTGWTTHTQFILDDAKADAALSALKAGMKSYEKYDNDKHKSVTIDTGDGEVTYRLESLVMVSSHDCSLGEVTIIEREVWQRSLEAKITARLAPAPSV